MTNYNYNVCSEVKRSVMKAVLGVLAPGSDTKLTVERAGSMSQISVWLM